MLWLCPVLPCKSVLPPNLALVFHWAELGAGGCPWPGTYMDVCVCVCVCVFPSPFCPPSPPSLGHMPRPPPPPCAIMVPRTGWALHGPRPACPVPPPPPRVQELLEHRRPSFQALSPTPYSLRAIR